MYDGHVGERKEWAAKTHCRAPFLIYQCSYEYSIYLLYPLYCSQNPIFTYFKNHLSVGRSMDGLIHRPSTDTHTHVYYVPTLFLVNEHTAHLLLILQQRSHQIQQ